MYTSMLDRSDSESERARNGTSESWRDFSREQATIHTSESKQAKNCTIFSIL